MQVEIPLRMSTVRAQLLNGKRLTLKGRDGMFCQLYWSGAQQQFMFIKGYDDDVSVRLEIDLSDFGIERSILLLLNEFGELE